jgi:PTS system cellobiose-specific IIB component
MIKIILICAGGVSTSMMVAKMKKAAQAKGLNVNIIATGADEFIDEGMTCDILLVAPQISYQYDEIKNDYQDQIKVIQKIDKVDYGAMNGEKVLENAIAKLNS